MTEIFDELQWRGLVAQTTDESALRMALADGPITAYCGFDPTAPSLHFGNLVQLIVLRHLQRAGHKVICLVGGSTGLIGDPRPSAERVLKTKDQTAQWVARIQELVRPFLDFDGSDPDCAHPAVMVNNLDWTEPMSALDFLRDVGKHFRVNQMVKKEAVAARLGSAEGISYTEFSYQLLQGLDYLELYRSYGCTLQTGGQDQWGNLTAGSDLIHRVEGASVHLLTTPLITDSAGVKFGKSEGNAVWLSADMTSPYAFYQYFLNTEDASVVALLKVFTDLSHDEIADLERQVADEPFRRAAQKALAAEITTLVHGPRRRHRCRWLRRPCSARGTSACSTPAPSGTRRPSCRVGTCRSARRSPMLWSPWAWSTRATRLGARSGTVARRSTRARSPTRSGPSRPRTSSTVRWRCSAEVASPWPPHV